MARLAVGLTVILLLFAFSQAGSIQEHDVTPEETVKELPESDSNTANSIVLPSVAKVVDFKHDDDASETNSDVDSVPLTMISFRPINRHFLRRPMVPFRHKRNCRFHKRFRPRFQQKRYISYGDDMILADESTRVDPEKSGVEISGVIRQIQARWPRFPDDATESVDFIKPHHHDHEHDHDHDHDHDEDHHHYEHEDEHQHEHHHRRSRRQHHHHEVDDSDDEREEHKHEHKGGFMESFRKVFGHF